MRTILLLLFITTISGMSNPLAVTPASQQIVIDFDGLDAGGGLVTSS